MLDQTLSLTQLRPPPGFYCPGQFVREPNGVCVLWLRLIHLTHTGAIFFQLIFNFLVGFFHSILCSLDELWPQNLWDVSVNGKMVKFKKRRKKRARSWTLLSSIRINGCRVPSSLALQASLIRHDSSGCLIPCASVACFWILQRTHLQCDEDIFLICSCYVYLHAFIALLSRGPHRTKDIVRGCI